MNLSDLPTLRQLTLGVEQVYHLRDPNAYRLLCEQLFADGFDFPQCLSGVDMEYGLRVVLNLRRLKDQAEVTIWLDVAYDEPRLPTVCDLWGGLEWHEREAYDLLGLHFEHHPDLRRILLEDHWTIHPLQRRYDTGGYMIPGWQPKQVPDWEALDRKEAEAARKEEIKRQEEAASQGTPSGKLTDIRALNANYAAKLEAQGINSLEALAALPDDKLGALAAAIGLKSPVAIKKWREGAKALLASTPTAEKREAEVTGQKQGSGVRDQGSEKPTPDLRHPTSGSDLAQIRALNANYAAKLQEQGITSLDALAELSDAQAEQLASTIGLKSPAAVNKWREGARELVGNAPTAEKQGSEIRGRETEKLTPDPQPPIPDTRHPDDLTKIKGIGAVYEKMLVERGFTTFKQLAALSDEQIAKLEETMNFKGRVKREKWREQAEALMEGESK